MSRHLVYVVYYCYYYYYHRRRHRWAPLRGVLLIFRDYRRKDRVYVVRRIDREVYLLLVNDIYASANMFDDNLPAYKRDNTRYMHYYMWIGRTC